jgi:hypothetical protein
MEKEIYSDDVSETYRKYVIKIKLSNGNCYYSLWATDLNDKDFDYLLVNATNKILVFSRIVDLLSYIRESGGLIDEDNTKKWVSMYKNEKAYSTYDLTSLLPFFDETIAIEQYKEENAMELIDFVNLFSDFANQIKSCDLIELRNNENMDTFIDYLYMVFFWDTPDASYELDMKNKIASISLSEVRQLIKKMVYSFENSILIVN